DGFVDLFVARYVHLDINKLLEFGSNEKFQQGMPVPPIARQSRRLNAEHGADLPIAQRAQQAFKAGATCSASRDSEIVIDYVDVLPAQRAHTIDQSVLAALTFKVVLHLT